EPLQRATPGLRAIGPNIYHVGPVGAGNTVKAINNMMACVNSLAMMEGLVLGRKAGLDPMTIYEVVKASSGGSKALERIPTAIVPRNFAPGFKVFLMNKDLETFNTIAKELHVPVSFSNVAQRYQQAAMAAGLADQDTSVAMTIIERLAAIDRKRPGAWRSRVASRGRRKLSQPALAAALALGGGLPSESAAKIFLASKPHP